MKQTPAVNIYLFIAVYVFGLILQPARKARAYTTGRHDVIFVILCGLSVFVLFHLRLAY